MERATFALIGLLLLSSASGCPSSSSSQPATAPTAAAQQPVYYEWRTVGQWSGRGEKQTETFSVPRAPLRLTWEADDLLAVQLYRDGGGYINGVPYVLAINTTGQDHDTTTLRASGNFYLNIHALGPYHIRAEAQFPQESLVKAEAVAAAGGKIKLLLDSVPQGAAVSIAGEREVLGRTPVSITTDRQPGKAVTMRFKLAGHVTVDREIELDKDRDVLVPLESPP